MLHELVPCVVTQLFVVNHFYFFGLVGLLDGFKDFAVAISGGVVFYFLNLLDLFSARVQYWLCKSLFFSLLL